MGDGYLSDKRGMPAPLRALYEERMGGRLSQSEFERQLALLVARDVASWRPKPLPTEPTDEDYRAWREWKRKLADDAIRPRPKKTDIEEADSRILRNYRAWFDSNASISRENQFTADFLAWVALTTGESEIGASEAVRMRLLDFERAGYRPNSETYRRSCADEESLSDSLDGGTAPATHNPRKEDLWTHI